MASAHTENWRN